MSQSSSDAAMEFVKVGRDGIRFCFGAELHLPEQPGQPPYEPPRPPDDALPVQHDRFWVTAASPPPNRDGLTWEWGLLLNDPDADEPPPFRPTGAGSEESQKWRSWGITWVEGIPSLDKPAPETIILDQALPVPFEWEREMTFDDGPDPLGFLSVPYRQPYEYDPGLTSVGVNYFAEFTLPWSTPLPQGAWVAISFDRFWPPDRTSADFITQVDDCNLFHPRSWPASAVRRPQRSEYPGTPTSGG
jgi:hypothetical protein